MAGFLGEDGRPVEKSSQDLYRMSHVGCILEIDRVYWKYLSYLKPLMTKCSNKA